MSRFRIRMAGAVAGLAAIGASLFPTMASADVPPDQVPASLQAAIKAEIESQGHEYAGLCRVVNEQQPLPAGKYCAFVLSIEHDIAEVTYGLVASDELQRASFVNQSGNWVKEGAPATPTTPSDPGTPRPPSTGEGSISGGDSGNTDLLVMSSIAALAVAGLGVSVAYSRKR